MTGFARGVLINFLYAAQHELSHATVFKTRVINEWFGRAIGFIEIFPRDYDQIMHFAHHQYTQNWERDGDLARNAAGDGIFPCELGPPEYAMTGPDGREMSNRWDELGGDD